MPPPLFTPRNGSVPVAACASGSSLRRLFGGGLPPHAPISPYVSTLASHESEVDAGPESVPWSGQAGAQVPSGAWLAITWASVASHDTSIAWEGF